MLFVDQRCVYLDDEWKKTTFGGTKPCQSPQAVAFVNEVRGESPHSCCGSSEEVCIVRRPDGIRIVAGGGPEKTNCFSCWAFPPPPPLLKKQKRRTDPPP